MAFSRNFRLSGSFCRFVDEAFYRFSEPLNVSPRYRVCVATFGAAKRATTRECDGFNDWFITGQFYRRNLSDR